MIAIMNGELLLIKSLFTGAILSWGIGMLLVNHRWFGHCMTGAIMFLVAAILAMMWN